MTAKQFPREPTDAMGYMLKEKTNELLPCCYMPGDNDDITFLHKTLDNLNVGEITQYSRKCLVYLNAIFLSVRVWKEQKGCFKATNNFPYYSAPFLLIFLLPPPPYPWFSSLCMIFCFLFLATTHKTEHGFENTRAVIVLLSVFQYIYMIITS